MRYRSYIYIIIIIVFCSIRLKTATQVRGIAEGKIGFLKSHIRAQRQSFQVSETCHSKMTSSNPTACRTSIWKVTKIPKQHLKKTL